MRLNKLIKNSTKFKKIHRSYKRIIANYFLNNSKFYPENIDRVYHFHIRKSAGTSINAVFWKSAGLNSLSEVKTEPILIGNKKSIIRNDKCLIEKGKYFYASSHFPIWEINHRPNTFTFTILREPYERLVSLYKYYQWVYQVKPEIGRKSDPSYDYLIKQKHLQNVSFLEFIGNLSKKYLFGQLYFYSKGMNIEDALKNLKKLNVVCFNDDFSEIIPTLSINLKIHLNKPKRERNFENVNYNITDEEKTIARDLLKDEIEFYNQAKIIFNKSRNV